jgi:hypothetical protein
VSFPISFSSGEVSADGVAPHQTKNNKEHTTTEKLRNFLMI